jgi:hypothetical protein
VVIPRQRAIRDTEKRVREFISVTSRWFAASGRTQ